ncbi:MAG: hypothetical protein M8861_01185, partial [marine benthic group bacterium]|nr:hypothetical protein [Gemmatimonadota bacterium]
LIGFPVALILAWTFEVSRDGVQRTGTYEAASGRERRWPLVSRRAVIAVAVIGVVYFGFLIVRQFLPAPP